MVNGTNSLVKPVNTLHTDVNVERAVEQWKTYQKLTHVLLIDSDYQKIGGRLFKKKSAWRKYMRAFNISTTVLEKDITRDKSGRVIDANFLVKAMSPDGRFAEGFGNCSKFERGFQKHNHDIPSTAMTRAINRAVSDLIGAGEVSAEEIEKVSPPLREVPAEERDISSRFFKEIK
jgi:hypothetical protein